MEADVHDTRTSPWDHCEPPTERPILVEYVDSGAAILDWRSRELATVGALVATPGVEPQLRSHMAASMRVGLTAGQLRQLIEVLAEGGEADAANHAADALTQALAAMQAEH